MTPTKATSEFAPLELELGGCSGGSVGLGAEPRPEVLEGHRGCKHMKWRQVNGCMHRMQAGRHERVIGGDNCGHGCRRKRTDHASAMPAHCAHACAHLRECAHLYVHAHACVRE
eukprot:1153947-Pelagomonas_calceolata.AAC.4